MSASAPQYFPLSFFLSPPFIGKKGRIDRRFLVAIFPQRGSFFPSAAGVCARGLRDKTKSLSRIATRRVVWTRAGRYRRRHLFWFQTRHSDDGDRLTARPWCSRQCIVWRLSLVDNACDTHLRQPNLRRREPLRGRWRLRKRARNTFSHEARANAIGIVDSLLLFLHNHIASTWNVNRTFKKKLNQSCARAHLFRNTMQRLSFD